MVLDSSLLNTQQYKERIKGSSYWKGSFLVALDYGFQLLTSSDIGSMGRIDLFENLFVFDRNTWDHVAGCKNTLNRLRRKWIYKRFEQFPRP